MTSDAESDFAHEDMDSDVGAVLDELSLENIRQISKNITSKFGATRSAFRNFNFFFTFVPVSGVMLTSATVTWCDTRTVSGLCIKKKQRTT